MASRIAVEEVALEAIAPHPRNARRHPPEQLERLTESLRTFGQYRPIVVQRRTGYILMGHGVYEAAKALGWKTIAVTYLDVDDRHAHTLLLADNRLAELSYWDYNALLQIPDLLTVLQQPLFDSAFLRLLEVNIEAFAEESARAMVESDAPPLEQHRRAETRHAREPIVRTVLVRLTASQDAQAQALHEHLRKEDTDYAEEAGDGYDEPLFHALLRRAAGAD